LASKLHNFFQQCKKIGGEGASISFAAFEKEGHFRRHLRKTIILSFANKGHKKGYMITLRGIERGISKFVRSFRKANHLL